MRFFNTCCQVLILKSPSWLVIHLKISNSSQPACRFKNQHLQEGRKKHIIDSPSCTGVHGGAIRLTELALERPILWDICLLHNNELPFKDFFKYCDHSGNDYWKDTKCPAYSGHIGKNFKPKLSIQPVLPFTRIAGKVPIYSPNFVATFNNDSRYFYQMCHAVQNGVVPPTLAQKVISRVDQARLIFSPGYHEFQKL